ncbi:MAG: efflux RND transporter periplasmic adaptor subunit [Paucibacter sp.]|nr:efflux RND transporter periplasmic adaptor subunit [Roseateles sp.]
MRKQWWIGGAAMAMLATGAAVAVYASKGDEVKHKDGEPAKVALEFQQKEITRPIVSPMPDEIEFSGPLVAPGTVTVKSKAAGTLVSLSVSEGSRVQAGQALGQLDLEELRARVAERHATVASVKAQFDQAERTYRTNEALAAKNFIATTALDNSRAAMETARAQWQAAQAQLDTMQVSLRQAALVAPINGVVAKRLTLPGEKVAPEQALLTIVDLSKLELAGLVGTHEVSRLTPGMPANLRVEGFDQPVRARIARINPAAEPGTRSIGVVLALDNPGERFRAGQYGVAKVELADKAERLTLPETAISNNSGQEQVWLIEDGKLARRIVTTGRRDAREGRVEILKGVNADAQVLAARFDNLRDGDKVAVVSTKARIASSAASVPVVR